ncbi:MAG: phage tail assembly chaperone [Rhizobiaceae bacterium]|nr:phage tail assembly chaperone [Rhizobiaceae bacterium]
MAFGLGRLRLAPRDFWAMTPRELAAAMSAYSAPVAAPGRDELDRLMRQFPDTKERAG